MEYGILLALMTYGFATSVTPGPNNLMLLASGANFGFKRTIPHLLGIGVGFSFMVMIIGMGLAPLFETMPALRIILTVLSVSYMIYLAWKIATSSSPSKKKTGSNSKPFSFLQAAAFQWVNPKAWFMAITAQTAYRAEETISAAIIVGLVYFSVNVPSMVIWAWLGQGLRRFLSDPMRLNVFNWIMATLLIASLIPILFH